MTAKRKSAPDSDPKAAEGVTPQPSEEHRLEATEAPLDRLIKEAEEDNKHDTEMAKTITKTDGASYAFKNPDIAVLSVRMPGARAQRIEFRPQDLSEKVVAFLRSKKGQEWVDAHIVSK